MIISNDPIVDLLMRVKRSAPEIPDKTLHSIELEYRQVWGGETFYVAQRNTRERNRAMLEAYRQGKSIKSLACQFSITERQVRRIINRRKKIRNQLAGRNSGKS